MRVSPACKPRRQRRMTPWACFAAAAALVLAADVRAASGSRVVPLSPAPDDGGRVLVAAPPFQGHVYPLLALSKELVRRGYAVTFVTFAPATAWIDADSGLSVRAVSSVSVHVLPSCTWRSRPSHACASIRSRCRSCGCRFRFPHTH